jgi:hypothetical protein
MQVTFNTTTRRRKDEGNRETGVPERMDRHGNADSTDVFGNV